MMDHSKQGKLETTYTLRGIAVFIYITSHFRVVCWQESPKEVGYSNAAIALFFLVSGYGIYHSLKRRESCQGMLRSIPRFWKDRFLNILPQHVAALGLVCLFYKTNYSFWQYLGAESPFWAINQALQCYLAAPILYRLSRSDKAAVRLAPLMLWAVGNVLFLCLHDEIDRSGLLRQLVFRNLYGTYLVLFHLGMLGARNPLAIAKKLARVGGGPLIALWIGSLLVTGVNEASPWMLAGFTFLGVVVSTLFFQAAMALPQPIPGPKFFAKIGKASLSINLFEPLFYYGLFSLHLLIPKDMHSILWYAALYPVFTFGCMWIQRAHNALTGVAKKTWRLVPASIVARIFALILLFALASVPAATLAG